MFWGVLLWKRKAEEALIASGLPYTVSNCDANYPKELYPDCLIVDTVQIVRPGGMERPTDTFKETHNLTLSTEDTLFGGLVSNLQVLII